MKNFSSLGESLVSYLKNMPNIESLPDEDPDARCPLCDGYGNVIDDEGARPCTCVRREVVRSGIESAHIPDRFANESLDSFTPIRPSLKGCLNHACKYVESYSLDNPKGLYIYGSTGCGKTHIAIGILKALIARSFDGVFYNVVDLLDAIRSTYDPNSSPIPKGRLEYDLERQIFVLDDFGVQKTSSWVADRLYALINRRYQDCKTIIITSNIDMEHLLLQVENRLASRIIDMCEEVEIKAGDFRKQRIAEAHGGEYIDPSRRKRKRSNKVER